MVGVVAIYSVTRLSHYLLYCSSRSAYLFPLLKSALQFFVLSEPSYIHTPLFFFVLSVWFFWAHTDRALNTKTAKEASCCRQNRGTPQGWREHSSISTDPLEAVCVCVFFSFPVFPCEDVTRPELFLMACCRYMCTPKGSRTQKVCFTLCCADRRVAKHSATAEHSSRFLALAGCVEREETIIG